MLSGKYKHTIDAKGRVIVPIRFREDLGDTFIVTRGLDECLALYSMQEWSGLEEKITAAPDGALKADTAVSVLQRVPPSNWTGRGGLYSRRICVNSRD